MEKIKSTFIKKHISFLMAIILTVSMAYGLTACGDGLKKLDLFDLITVKFNGINGEGSISFENNDTILEKDWHNLIKLETENNGQLSNGDEIVVRIKNISRKDLGAELMELGYKVKDDPIEKTFTVTGLSELLSRDDLTDEMVNILEEYTKNHINVDRTVVNKSVVFAGEAIDDQAEYGTAVLVAMDYTITGYEHLAPELRENLSSGAIFMVFYDYYSLDNEQVIHWKKAEKVNYIEGIYINSIFDEATDSIKSTLEQYQFTKIK